MNLLEDLKLLKTAPSERLEYYGSEVRAVCGALEKAQAELCSLRNSLVTYLSLQDIHGRTGKTPDGLEEAHMDLLIGAQSASALLKEWGTK